MSSSPGQRRPRDRPRARHPARPRGAPEAQGVDGAVLPEAEEFLRRAAPAVAIDPTLILGSAIRENASWVTPDGTTAARVGHDGSVGVWDLRNGSRILGRPSPDDSCGATIGCPDVFNVSLSDDAHLMATGDGEGLAHVWDLDSGREVMTASTRALPGVLAGSFGRDFDVSPIVALSPDGRLLATVGSGASLGMWEVSTGARVWALAPEGTDAFGPPSSVLMGPDSSCAPGGGLPVSWTSPPGRQWSPRACDFGCGTPFSADGSRIAFAVNGGWLVARRGLGPAAANEGRGGSVDRDRHRRNHSGRGALSPDGRVLAGSGVPHRTSCCWRTRTRLLLDALEHRVRVFQVTFSTDGTRIVTSSDDGAAQVWNAQTGKRLHVARRVERSDRSRVQSGRVEDRAVLLRWEGSRARDRLRGRARDREGASHALAHGCRVPHVPPCTNVPDGLKVGTMGGAVEGPALA